MDRLVNAIRQIAAIRLYITLIGAVVGIGLIWWIKRRGGRTKEGFQQKTTVPKMEEILKEIPIPPEVAAPEPVPPVSQDLCSTIKKSLDALRLTEINKSMKEYVASSEFQVMKSDMEEKFRTLGCEEQLEKIKRGEIPAPQTSPDMRPPPPTKST